MEWILKKKDDDIWLQRLEIRGRVIWPLVVFVDTAYRFSSRAAARRANLELGLYARGYRVRKAPKT